MIIGIGYSKQSGKDTFGDMLINLFKEQNIIICKDAFAEGLKKSLMLLFPQIKHRHMWGSEEDKMEKIPGLSVPGKPYACGRWLCQFFGTECCRAIYSDIWVNQLCLRSLQQTSKVTITTDLRHKNEAKLIKDNGGIIIKMDRGIVSGDEHQSENDLVDYTDWDLIIENKSDLESLAKEAKEVFNTLLLPRYKKQ
jgi:hypothetical protein